MVARPNPVLLYHPDGYRVARADLKGRHSAGESFLDAFLQTVEGPEVYGLLLNSEAVRNLPKPLRQRDAISRQRSSPAPTSMS